MKNVDQEQVSRNFKGIWIPAHIWLHPELSMLEKILWAEIDSLDHPEKGCTASNKYFCDFFDRSETQIRDSISNLKKHSLIYLENFDGKVRCLRSVHKKYPSGFSKNSPPENRRSDQRKTVGQTNGKPVVSNPKSAGKSDSTHIGDNKEDNKIHSRANARTQAQAPAPAPLSAPALPCFSKEKEEEEKSCPELRNQGSLVDKVSLLRSVEFEDKSKLSELNIMLWSKNYSLWRIKKCLSIMRKMYMQRKPFTNPEGLLNHLLKDPINESTEMIETTRDKVFEFTLQCRKQYIFVEDFILNPLTKKDLPLSLGAERIIEILKEWEYV